MNEIGGRGVRARDGKHGGGRERRTLLIIRWHRIHYPGRGTNGPGSSRNSLIQIPLGTHGPRAFCSFAAARAFPTVQNTVNYRGDGRKGAPRGPCPSFATSFTCTDFPPFNSTRSNDSSFPIFLQSRVEEFVFTSSRIEERILPIYETGCKRNVSFSLIDRETNLIIWISIFRRINSREDWWVLKILLFFFHSFTFLYNDIRDWYSILKKYFCDQNEGQEDLFWEKKRERFDSVEREEETKFLGQDCRRIQGTRQGYPRTTQCNLMTLIAIVKTNDERGNPVKLGRGFEFPIWYAIATVIYFPFEEKIRTRL